MKILTLFITLLLFNFSNTNAQNFDKSKLSDLSPYVGTWVGSNGIDSLAVFLKKEEVYFEPLDVNVDRLIGKFELYKNGQLITSNFNTKENTLITGGLRRTARGKPSLLDFTFRDLKIGKRGQLSLIFKDSSEKVIRWELRAKEGIIIGKKRPENYGEFSVPKKMTLRKIK